jgi:membrane associated rhomboid family serine protease
MSSESPDSPGPLVDDSKVTYCYGHPDTPTNLRCSRCDRPICGRCSIPATVGQHCPWCVAEARKSAPKVRSALVASSPAVVGIIAVNVAVYVAQNLLPVITRTFASYPPAIHAGQWWRLVTPMFLHAPLGSRLSLLHIVFNMLVLRIYGPQVEEALGTWRFVALYLIAGFFASAASYAFGPCNVLGLGASGAIFGVVGILLVILYNRRRSAFVRDYMKNLLFFIGINLVIGFALPGIDYFAHMGGLAAGIALGAGFDRSSPSPSGRALQTMSGMAVVAAAVALVAWRTATFVCG